MTILHNTPEKYISPRMESYSHLWCYPVFHQGWALFAPDPQDMTKHMEISIGVSGKYSKWTRSEEICIDEHIKYRVSHYSKLCHVNQNAAYHLWLSLNDFELQDKPAEEFYPTSTGYGIAVHYAKNYAYHYFGQPSPDEVRVRLVLEDPFEIEESAVYEFPVYTVGEE